MKRILLAAALLAAIVLTACSKAPADTARITAAPEIPFESEYTPMPADELPAPTQTPAPSEEEIYSDAELTREYFSSRAHDISAVDETLLLEYPILREYYIENVPFAAEELEMHETPDSSCFSEVGYSAVREMLAVRFRSSGAAYLYYEVPPEAWDAFCSAPSLGKYYNAYIKPAYASERWDG